MQPAGGGTPGPRSCDGLPRSVRQLDPAALLMLLVDADRPEPVRSGARELALFLTPEPGAEVGDWGWRWGRRVSEVRGGWVRPRRSGPGTWTRTQTLRCPAEPSRTRSRGFGPGVGDAVVPSFRGVVTA